MQKLFHLVFGDPNKKVIDALRADAQRITALEPALTAMSDEQLRGVTTALRERIAKGETLSDVTSEAFAAVREASKRALRQRHYDVQLMGGLTLLRGGIAEMRTGEGKTLTATAPLYARALLGKGAHLVTVNDYLAKRDAVWMGQVFHALGMSVGVIQHDGSFLYDPAYKHAPDTSKEEKHDEERDTTGAWRVHMDYLRPVSRREAYAADVTYGTNNEFGFDYLRDNMAPTAAQGVQRGLHFAIVDEVDSILIDEARTPLIISAPAEQSSKIYYTFADIMKTLVENADYNVDEKMRAATLTASGIEKVERALGIENLYASGVNLQHYADNALRAHTLYKLDVNYVVKDGGVIIVDEFTGRLMPGRRFGEGQHQAIEAKEGVEIQRESLTLATITFQNLFRAYEALAGMTGTAATEAEEFAKIYKLEVTSIPTNIDTQRQDLGDRVFKTEAGKMKAVVEEVRRRHGLGQPVLVGTASIEKNELLGALLAREGVPFNLLNAKNHEKEAEIIAQAGAVGAVTIATNMAGRGVDIMLGGNPPDPMQAEKVKELGGLFVLGTERHESRRIDNQLRGRAGRQGDPGATQFFVSLEDDLMRIFGGDRTKALMEKLGIPDDMPIENGMVSRSIEKAQQRVEGHHFDTRKHILEYDDVLNKHRQVIYERRHEVLDAFDKGGPTELREKILELVEGEVEQVVLFHTGEALGLKGSEGSEGKGPGDWDVKEIVETMSTIVPLTSVQKEKLSALTLSATKDKMHVAEQRTKVIEAIIETVREAYDALEKNFPNRAALRQIERGVILRAMDTLWIDHLSAMTALRHGIGLQGYGQRDPLVEYKKESYQMFQRLLAAVNQEAVYTFFKAATHAIAQQRAQEEFNRSVFDKAGVTLQGAVTESKPSSSPSLRGAGGDEAIPSTQGKVGRNDQCPCGSGKKYKKCHGK
ncbi:preprotein translocase subunit SecA [Candidatus Uhrbacteria bacterium RIFCSPHIGHO2_01_FULL_63_20]|uniref:Protein translocase subunit SecA n=1 Tax=Candidatus Uhrbacteria bacterium RIFCSPHIGHO2_01_FULL_63_20 TaxID=1802385 RepID=A0A1F7TKA1_9BACT|nr:MAG: preprotein translocase subunit SecA [Candidatus Uhrbacteria bacterium RIFCSPHIGHO2_01_FULL_63_20]